MAINLLPEKGKKELRVEGIGRKVSLVFLFLFIFFLVLIFILLALKIYILSQVKYSQDTLESKEKSLRSSQFQDFKQTIKETNQNLSKIKSFYGREIFLTPLLEKLSNLIPQTIYFTNLSLEKIFQETELLTEIHISGYARTRQDLFSFKKYLEDEKEFEYVYFSPSSWVIPTDIEFSLSFKFTPNFEK
ncbi:PilN domain-containing protein [Patescibacteria group bacterium]|nr:PilN domain-containing protein [Patescibacteria group bacterium]